MNDRSHPHPTPRIDMTGDIQFRRPRPPATRSRDHELSAEARAFYAGMHAAPATRDAYSRQWRRFATWCGTVNRSPEPATTATVLEYVHWLYSQRGQYGQPTSPNTVALAMSAIMKRHEIIAAAERSRDSEAMYPIPDRSAIKDAVRAYRRRWAADGHRVIQAREIDADDLRRIVAVFDPDSITGVRNLAMVTLAFGMMARPGELASLRVRDVRIDPDHGLSIHVPWSKTDQSAIGADTEVTRAPGDPLCPLTAFRRWLDLLDAHGHTSGPLFFPVNRATVKWPAVIRPLTTSGVSNVVVSGARKAGLTHDQFAKYGGHSLRAGGATSAARAGGRVEDIAHQGRWSDKSPVVLRYIRRGRGQSSANVMARVYQT